MLWLNFILGLNSVFFCFKIIIIHYHTQKLQNYRSNKKWPFPAGLWRHKGKTLHLLALLLYKVRVNQSYNSYWNFRLVSSQVPLIFHFLSYWHLLGIHGPSENSLGEWVTWISVILLLWKKEQFMQYFGLAINNSQSAGCGNYQHKKLGFLFFAPLLPLKLGSNLCGCCKSFVS